MYVSEILMTVARKPIGLATIAASRKLRSNSARG
jgi:hypothetical protein